MELEQAQIRNEAYYTDDNGRVIGICHKTETLSKDELAKAALVAPATTRLAPPVVSATEQASMFVVDGNLEWRVEERPLTPEELAVAPLKAMLERIEAKLDAHIASSTVASAVR